MSGIQEGNSKTEFAASRPITQMELPGSILAKPSIMISSMRPTIPFSKGQQQVVAKVMQTPTIGHQAPNILVVGQARMPQPSANLLVPAGSTGGFIMSGSVVGDKAGPASAILSSLQQTQQLQQAQQQLLQQHQQQPHPQNLLNSLVTLSGAGGNLAPANNHPGPFASSASGMVMDITQHNLMSGAVNLQNRIIRNRAPAILENRATLPSIQTTSARTSRPAVIPLNKPQQLPVQVASSSSSPSSIHMVAMGTLSLSTPPLVGGSSYVVTNPGQRVILSASRATLPQLQRPSMSSVAIRSPWPNQIQPQTPSSSSAVARNAISTVMADVSQRSPSVTVQPLVRPAPIPGAIQQQQTTRALLSSPLTSPINLSISTMSSSAPAQKSIILGQSQALNLSQPMPRQPTVILASTCATKTTTASPASQQVNKIISQTPLNLTKPRKVKLQSGGGGGTAYSTLSLTPASTLKTAGSIVPIQNMASIPVSSSSVVPVAKVIPQMHIVNSGSQQIQLHQIQAASAQIHVQQPQQTHLVSGSVQGQTRTAVTSVQTASLIPLQPANTMLIGGSYIASGSAVIHTDKPHLLQQFSIQDSSRIQGAHLLPQSHLSLGGLAGAVQTITIPASANIRAQNSGNVAIMTSSLMPSSSATNVPPQASSRMQPVVLSIDSSGHQALQNFAFVATPTVMAAVGSSECAADLSQKESAAQQLHQQQQHHLQSLHVPTSSSSSLKLPMQQQFVSLEGTSAATYGGSSNNGINSGTKQQNQSPRPPSILRKRTHDSLSSTTKKNLFTAPSSSMIPMNSGTSLALTSSSSNLFSSTGQVSYFQQNLPAQLQSVQQQQQQQNQLFLHQSLGSALTASDVVVKLSGVVALGPNEGGLQFVVPTSPQAFDVAKDSSQSSTDTASSTENTPKPNQSLPSDTSRNCKVNVVASSNGALRVAMENSGAKQPEEEEVKLHSRKKPRKQQLIAQTPSSFPSDVRPPAHKDVLTSDVVSEEEEEEDNIDDGADDLTNMPGSGECSLEESLSVFKFPVEREYRDKNGVRWTQVKQRPCDLNIAINQFQCPWKPLVNHFVSHDDIKPKEEKKPSITELSNQRCILQRISGYKLYLISDHLNLLKEEEEETMSSMEELKMTLGEELQSLNMTEEFQSTNELIMAYTQRSKKCIEHLEEGKESLLKLLNGKAKANEIVSKHQSKRVVKKKDRS